MEIDNQYRIIYDDNNVILQFHEMRTKVKKDKSKEEFEFLDSYYYSNVKQALKSYVNKKLKYCESITEMIDRVDNLEILISKLNK